MLTVTATTIGIIKDLAPFKSDTSVIKPLVADSISLISSTASYSLVSTLVNLRFISVTPFWRLSNFPSILSRISLRSVSIRMLLIVVDILGIISW